MSQILEANIFILPQRLTVSNIESVKNELIKYVLENMEINLDGSIVEEIDSAGFQIILSVYKFCILQSKEFAIVGASNILRKVLEMTDLLELIVE